MQDIIRGASTPTAVEERERTPYLARFYSVAWRWHFYAGLYVIPFAVMLALTGLVMLYHDAIETVQYRDRLFVAPSGRVLPAETQLAAVRAAFPGATVSQYIPPVAADRSSQFGIKTQTGQDLTVFVDPGAGAVLGAVEKSTTWYAIANDIHGSLLLGDTGDHLIEIAAGFMVVLIISGFYLWWPRDWRSLVASFRLRSGRRARWRQLHSVIGVVSAAALLFFAISGLAWTGVWGGKLVQPWSSFPAERTKAPLSDETHAALNHGSLKEVPWGLEQTPLPASGSMAGAEGIPAGIPVTLDSVIAYARDNGFTHFRVNLPRGPRGVFTVSANTMSGDITDARQDRTLHLDQYTGKKLADIGWDDYSPMAKAMAAGIALHEGRMGWWSVFLNTIFCLAVLFLAVSGVVMWWLRRPSRSFRLVAPPVPANLPLWQGAVVVMLAVSLAFPLVGITLLIVLALDWLLLSRLPVLKHMVS